MTKEKENKTEAEKKPLEDVTQDEKLDDNYRPLDTVYDVPVKVSVVLGSAKMSVNNLLKLGRGAVVELDRKAGDPIDVFVNDRLIAKGEIVLVDEKIAISLTDIIDVKK